MLGGHGAVARLQCELVEAAVWCEGLGIGGRPIYRFSIMCLPPLPNALGAVLCGSLCVWFRHGLLAPLGCRAPGNAQASEDRVQMSMKCAIRRAEQQALICGTAADSATCPPTAQPAHAPSQRLPAAILRSLSRQSAL